MSWSFIGRIHEVEGQGSYFLQCLLYFGLFSKFYDMLGGIGIFAVVKNIKSAGFPQPGQEMVIFSNFIQLVTSYVY